MMLGGLLLASGGQGPGRLLNTYGIQDSTPSPTPDDYPAQNVSSVQVEKPCCIPGIYFNPYNSPGEKIEAHREELSHPSSQLVRGRAGV